MPSDIGQNARHSNFSTSIHALVLVKRDKLDVHDKSHFL